MSEQVIREGNLWSADNCSVQLHEHARGDEPMFGVNLPGGYVAISREVAASLFVVLTAIKEAGEL